MFISSCFVLAKPKKEKETISFRFAKHNGIMGWQNSGIKNKIRNKSKKIWIKSSFTCSYVFQNFSGISWFLQNSGISFIVMANTIFLPIFSPDEMMTCLLLANPGYLTSGSFVLYWPMKGRERV